MTMVKVCGLGDVADVRAAIQMGADVLGFIHVPSSPRFVDHQLLERLLAEVGPEAGPRVRTAVVVQDAEETVLARLRRDHVFDWFQFHGSETPETVREWGGYKTIHVRDGVTETEMGAYESPFLIDTAVGGQRGGTGKTFDWSVLNQMKGDYFVAGGLNPENVRELVLQYRPWGVDVSSGIECEPGRKDHAKLARFMEQVRSIPA